MSQHRWFAVAKYSSSMRLRSTHDMNGERLYSIPVVVPIDSWWIFHELEAGDEKPYSGVLQEGLTCCMLYPDGERHVLANVYTHKPIAGYPRLYQIAPDDLPAEIREGCYYDGSKVLYFPDQKTLPGHLQPLYGALAAACPGAAPLEFILKDLLTKYRHSPLHEEEEESPEMPPGG